MGDISKNFDRAEFTCKCGCGFDRPDPRLVEICQKIRDGLGRPIRINSACRCEKHNKAVGGVEGSYHTRGMAADLSCEEGSQRLQAVIKSMYENNEIPELKYCKRYITRSFVHVDVGHVRRNMFGKG